MTILDILNDPQRAAVTAQPGPVLVLAGPGSGKTRVLTHRIAYLIDGMGVAPWRIMAVTFTNKAAREMRERVSGLMGGELRGLSLGTFHATCVRILRREVDHIGYYDRDFVIFDTADQRQVVKQALLDLNLDDKKFSPVKMLNGISSAKNAQITPEEYQATTYIAAVNQRVYERYQEILRANNAMDFDDLLLNAVLLFEERPDVLQKYQEQYHHILVDEFQDTNATQYKLLSQLAAGHGSLFVVGDSDQSIYRWRGADYQYIQKFREKYPERQEILLEQNYRSTQIILDAAKAVIQHNSNRVHKDLFTDRAGGDLLVVREAYNDQEEADNVISTIKDAVLYGYAPGDCAVMYRTNAQSRSLEEAFVRANMPYRLVGATQFYQRREVKDIIAYMRLVHNPADSISFGRVLNTPPRGIGKKTKEDLLYWAGSKGWHPAEALLSLATDPDLQHPFANRAYKALNAFGSLLNAWISLRDQVSVGELMDLIMDQTQFRQYIDDGSDEGEDRWANVMELYNVAATSQTLSLGEFLEQVALVSETDNLEEGSSATTLLTLHAAKGLEFPVVFIVGLEEGMLPHSRSLEDRDQESLAEERRLFYVGVTRAKDRVYLSHTFRRTHFGETEIATPSRFLQDIPDHLVDQAVSASTRRQQSISRVSSWDWSGGGSAGDRSWSSGSPRRGSSSTSRRTPAASQPKRQTRTENVLPPRRDLPTPRHQAADFDREPFPAEPGQPRYKTGEKVRHVKFGEGTVIESRLTGNDEEVSVAFQGVGVKKLAASFAKLEKIKG